RSAGALPARTDHGAGAGMIGAIVDTGTLGKVVLYSVVSGVGIAVVFGAGVSSVAGLLDALRQRRTAAGVAWGALSRVCIAGALARSAGSSPALIAGEFGRTWLIWAPPDEVEFSSTPT